MAAVIRFTRWAIFIISTVFLIPLYAQGSLEKIRVYGPALEGNLEGDDPTRDVYVYLPPGYEASGKRYPVIYYLHGYISTAQAYAERMLQLPASVDAAISGGARDVIIVLPDAYTRWGGSMFSNSPTIGDWETFIADDLVGYIDSHYRTLAVRESRGLAGHSMGGYGTWRIGMKRPELFAALYAASSCCLMFTAPGPDVVAAEEERMEQGGEAQGAMGNAMQSQAAAWASNPQNPPYYFDWPYVDGEAQPLVQYKWIANAPLVFVDQYVPALKQYRGIALDVGDQDMFMTPNSQMADALTRLGIDHGFEVYEGDHVNRVGRRFIDKVLPFFTEHLTAE